MPSWVECDSIDVDLTAPLRDRFTSIAPEAIDRTKALLQAVLNDVPTATRRIARLIHMRTGNRFRDEVRSAADKAGLDWRDVTLANVSYDLALAYLGCSTIALPTRFGPVLARNMDWWPEDLLARATYKINYCDQNGPRLTVAGWPGAVGLVTGMSRNGFAIALNAVMSAEGLDKLGYPVLLHLRRVLEDASDFEAALDMLSEPRLAMSGLITLVGTENDQRVVVERTPTRCVQRRPESNKPLVATNDYRLLDCDTLQTLEQLAQTSCGRSNRLHQLTDSCPSDQDLEDEQLLYILTDLGVIQNITAQHVIMRPYANEARVFVPARLLEADDPAAA